MKDLKLGGVLLATMLAAASAVWGQSAEREAFRGTLPDGEVDRSLEPPSELPEDSRMIALPKLEPETVRSLPFGNPAELERGFGTVTRRSDGEVVREGPASEVLDALRRKNDDVSPNARPRSEQDPLFSNDEEARAIVGDDNRIRVQDSTSYPFRVFGLLRTERGSCSATLVGPYTVVTAAHCVYDHENGGWVNETTFYPGANGKGNYPYRGYDYKETTILRGFIDNWRDNYGSVVPWDLAVISLRDGAGDRLGWLGYSANSGGDFRAYNVGYPGDKPFATMWRDKCDVSSLEVSGTEYVHRCDTKPGSSGSSMYRYVKNGSDEVRHVEGINVAEVETGNRDTNYNVGVLFTGPYFDWINSLRGNK